jgi:hypothetical protein
VITGVSFIEDVLLVEVSPDVDIIDVVVAPTSVQIAATGLQGEAGPQGLQGPQGEPGIVSVESQYYRHDQMVASALWVVNHNLGYRPNVSVTDSAGTNVEGEISHVDSNSLVLTFSSPFTGTADCS